MAVAQERTVFWSTEGDYSMSLAFVNKTGEISPLKSTTISVIHVLSESELLSEKANRVNIGISFALVYFAFFEGVYLWIDHREKKDKEREKLIRDLVRLIQEYSSKKKPKTD
jgi:hypothetical protein